MQRGDVWFAATPGGDRPVLVLTRDPVADRIGSVVVAAITRSRRGLVSELDLTKGDDGLPSDCVVNFDILHTVPRERFGMARHDLVARPDGPGLPDARGRNRLLTVPPRLCSKSDLQVVLASRRSRGRRPLLLRRHQPEHGEGGQVDGDRLVEAVPGDRRRRSGGRGGPVPIPRTRGTGCRGRCATSRPGARRCGSRDGRSPTGWPRTPAIRDPSAEKRTNEITFWSASLASIHRNPDGSKSRSYSAGSRPQTWFRRRTRCCTPACSGHWSRCHSRLPSCVHSRPWAISPPMNSSCLPGWAHIQA